jgi:hypothetical protein
MEEEVSKAGIYWAITELFSGLTMYFSSKRTALRSVLPMRSPLSADQAEDLRVHYSNYFVSLVSAIELMKDSGLIDRDVFARALEERFSCAGHPDGKANLAYVVELRNAVVHRGLDIAAAAQFPMNVPLIIAPATIGNRAGTKQHQAFAFYLLGIIEVCEAAAGSAIEACLSEVGLLNEPAAADSLQSWQVGMRQQIARAPHMPDWGRQMAGDYLDKLELPVIHEIHLVGLRAALTPVALPDLRELSGTRHGSTNGQG